MVDGIVNSAPPKEIEIQVGTGQYLNCEYNKEAGKKCKFYVYRVDGKTKLGEKKEWVFRGRKNESGLFKSDEYFAPKFSWFEEDEEYIVVAFDLSISGGNRISCKDQVLVIRKGDIIINLYWGEIKGNYKDEEIKIYAEYTKEAHISEYSVKKGFIKFPIYIESDSSNKPTIIERDRSLISPSHSGSNYVASASSFKSEKELDIVDSNTIRLNKFFDYYCIVKLRATVLSAGTAKYDKRDVEESKIFKRKYHYINGEVIDFYREQGFVPKLFYREKTFIEGLTEFTIDTASVLILLNKIYDRTTEALDRDWGKLGKGLAGNIATEIAKWLFKKYKKSLFSEKYFNQEIVIAHEQFRSKRKEREIDFRAWFRKHNAKLTPSDPYFKHKVKKVNEELFEITGGLHPNQLTNPVKIYHYNKLYQEKNLPLQKIQVNWNSLSREFDKVESSTILFFEKAEKESKHLIL